MRIELMKGSKPKEIEERTRIVATSGQISQSDESLHDLYELNTDHESNAKSAGRIIGSGHTSIAEHDNLTFFITDVTPVIEQILIGQRLVSFTIKSRRYVDFRNSGFYTPDFSYLKNGKEIEKKYTDHINYLFDTYSKMVELGVPKEDARFILPYSFYSQIAMTLNARSLEKLITYCTTGSMSSIPEVMNFGLEMLKLAKEKVPYYHKIYEKLEAKIEAGKKEKNILSFMDKYYNEYKVLKGAKLINIGAYYDNYPKYKIDKTIIVSYIMTNFQKSFLEATKIYGDLTASQKEKIMYKICVANEQRELEQVSFSFEVPMTLAGLTHFTRHRMHSLMIPDFIPVYDLHNQIMPSSVKELCKDLYNEAVKQNIKVYEEFKKLNVEEKDLIYFNLSGTIINVSTTMNGRELLWMSRLRCCNRAQWEIREIVTDMVKQVQKSTKLYGSYLGSTCAVLGRCPEGKKTCGTPQPRINNYLMKHGK